LAKQILDNYPHAALKKSFILQQKNHLVKPTGISINLHFKINKPVF